jgi:hypothetical protein
MKKFFFVAMMFFIALTATFPSIVGSSSTAYAGTTRQHVFAILRPDTSGNWYIQNDQDHKPYGIDSYITQTSDYIRIFTCCTGKFYSHVGAISITVDDGFDEARVTASAGVGLNNATIIIRVNGVKINPADICSHVVSCDNGNLWIMMDMWETD